MINKRLFGAPIAKEVQEQLNTRQLTGYLGEKIPFIRMWTAPKLVATEELKEIIEGKQVRNEAFGVLVDKTDKQELNLYTAANKDNAYTHLPEPTEKDIQNYLVTMNQLTDNHLQFQNTRTNYPGSNQKAPSVDDILNSRMDKLDISKYSNISPTADENSSTLEPVPIINAPWEDFGMTEDEYNEEFGEVIDGPETYPTLSENSTQQINIVDDENPHNPIKQKAEAKKVTVTFLDKKITRKEIPYTQAVYLIGDYGYQTGYKSYDINKPISELNNPGNNIERREAGVRNTGIGRTEEVTETTETSLNKNQVNQISEELFPNELKNNELLKPVTGITSMTSETAGVLGVIKKTTVNFVVHNFEDFDRIYNQYFLKPGTSVFVDFGWNDAELYNPVELIEKSEEKSIEHYLYNDPKKDKDKEHMGVVTKNQGKLEVLCGTVTDYSAKVTKNGSVECSITLTSHNAALLSHKNDAKNTKLIDFELTSGIYKFGLRRLIAELPTETDEQRATKQALLDAINQPVAFDSNQKSVETYRKNLKYLFALNFGLTTKRIPDVAIEYGFFINSLEAEDCYISWGQIEDLLINSNYGFGLDAEDIQKGSNFNIRMDSSLSFTTFSKLHQKIQKSQFESGQTPPVYFFPPWWGNSNPNADADGSYTWKKEKYPSGYQGNVKSDKGDTNFGKIPLREVFINTSVVKNAFKEEQNKTIMSVVKSIIKSINEASDGLFDWHAKIGSVDAQIEVIDKNYSYNKELNQKINSNVNPFYVFNIMSPTSIVKDYNLEFKIPQGDIGNMYAIRGAGTENNISSTKTDIMKIVGVDVMDSNAPKILPFPEHGGYAAEKRINDTKSNGFTNLFNRAGDLVANELKTLRAGGGDFSPNTFSLNNEVEGDIEGLLTNNPEAIMSSDLRTYEENPTTTKKKTKKQQKITVLNNDRKMEKNNFKVYSSLPEYYSSVMSEGVSVEVPRLLPYTLSLSIHGISSVQPGDIFKVDYLPQMYLDKTYLQIVKVSHDINGGDWTTSFDTQFREIFPELKNDIFKLTGNYLDKVVSANIFSNGTAFDFKKQSKFSLSGDIGSQNPIFNQRMVATEMPALSPVPIEEMVKYMMYVKPLDTLKEGSDLSHIFEFEFSEEGVEYFHTETDDDLPGLTFNTMRVNLDDASASTLNSSLSAKNLRVVSKDEATVGRIFTNPGYEKQTAEFNMTRQMTDPTTIIADVLLEQCSVTPNSKYHQNYLRVEKGYSTKDLLLLKGMGEQKRYVTLLLPPFVPKTKFSDNYKYHMWVRNSTEYAIIPAPDTQNISTEHYNILKEYFENGDTIKLGDFEYRDIF
tara:strand:+ start:366 stop:4328 length:3963 start_codon:yes stop_codon:yes gene_type:complete